jgi:hypothetical protein
MSHVGLPNQALEVLLSISLSGYFDTFISVFPLYDKTAFYEYYDLQYSGTPTGGTAWYASLNVVLCLGSMILHDERRERELPLAENSNFRDEQGWKYFRNASSCFIDLMFGVYGNLMAVQAICGMVEDPLYGIRNELIPLLGIHSTDNLRSTTLLYSRSSSRPTGSWNGTTPQAR